jgi:hypothetical protein
VSGGASRLITSDYWDPKNLQMAVQNFWFDRSENATIDLCFDRSKNDTIKWLAGHIEGFSRLAAPLT